MADNFNTALAKALLKHDIDLLRFDAALRKEIFSTLNGMQGDIIRKINAAGTAKGASVAAVNKKLNQLTGSVAPTVSKAYKQITDTANSQLTKVAGVQQEIMLNELKHAVTVDLGFKKISPDILKLLPGRAMIEGAPFDKWFSKQIPAFQDAFLAEMREGLLAGETIDQLSRRVRGTAAAGFKDGIMHASRRQAQTLVRSSVLATANKARESVYQRNKDVIKGMQWLSTLDGRTTDICIALDQQAWDMDGKKLPGTTSAWQGPPPAHFNCRSTLVPVMKSFSELTKNPKIKKKLQTIAPRKRDGLRASMNGAVSDKLDYEDWLRQQSPQFQLDVLGSTKFRLWQSGQLSLRDMIDQSHNPLPIDALLKKTGAPTLTLEQALAEATDHLKIADTKFKSGKQWYEAFDEPVSKQDIYAQLDDTTVAALEDTAASLQKQATTASIYRNTDGTWSASRKKDVHDDILRKIFTKKRVAAATPDAGEKPIYSVFGGRGGSGKGSFTTPKKNGGIGAVDKDSTIVLDADEIKKLLPEYKGFNAATLHEESLHIINRATSIAERLGLNVAHDITMKGINTPLKWIDRFKKAGYDIHGYYMHVPRKEAALRAVKRFVGPKKDFSGRFVPPEVILANKVNEVHWDQMKKHFKKWEFYDNQGAKPKMIGKGGVSLEQQAKQLADDLAKYKDQVAKGIKPSKGVQASYNSLPIAEKKLIRAEIEQKIAAQQAAAKAAAEKAAQQQAAVEAKQQLETIKAQKGTFEKRAYDKLKKQGALDGLNDTDILEAIAKQVEIDKAAKKISDGIVNYKKAIIAGKVPPPAAQKIFNELDDAKQVKIVKEIDKKLADNAVASKVTPKEALDEYDALVKKYKAPGKIPDKKFKQIYIKMSTADGTVPEHGILTAMDAAIDTLKKNNDVDLLATWKQGMLIGHRDSLLEKVAAKTAARAQKALEADFKKAKKELKFLKASLEVEDTIAGKGFDYNVFTDKMGWKMEIPVSAITEGAPAAKNFLNDLPGKITTLLGDDDALKNFLQHKSFDVVDVTLDLAPSVSGSVLKRKMKKFTDYVEKNPLNVDNLMDASKILNDELGGFITAPAIDPLESVQAAKKLKLFLQDAYLKTKTLQSNDEWFNKVMANQSYTDVPKATGVAAIPVANNVKIAMAKFMDDIDVGDLDSVNVMKIIKTTQPYFDDALTYDDFISMSDIEMETFIKTIMPKLNAVLDDDKLLAKHLASKTINDVDVAKAKKVRPAKKTAVDIEGENINAVQSQAFEYYIEIEQVLPKIDSIDVDEFVFLVNKYETFLGKKPTAYSALEDIAGDELAKLAKMSKLSVEMQNVTDNVSVAAKMAKPADVDFGKAKVTVEKVEPQAGPIEATTYKKTMDDVVVEYDTLSDLTPSFSNQLDKSAVLQKLFVEADDFPKGKALDDFLFSEKIDEFVDKMESKMLTLTTDDAALQKFLQTKKWEDIPDFDDTLTAVGKEAAKASKSVTVAQIVDDAEDVLHDFRFGELDELAFHQKASKLLGTEPADKEIWDLLTASQIDEQIDVDAAALKKLIQSKEAAEDAIKAGGNTVAKDAPSVKVAADIAEDQSKTKVKTPKTDTPPNAEDMNQIGGQGGSNSGAMYQDPETGIKWYVKTPVSEDMVRNEVLAAKLYEKMGIEVPELHIVTRNGKPSVASKIIDGLQSNPSALKAGKVSGVGDGFIADAWLGNWDVVGLGYDNLLVKANRAIRIDTGGALRYRAQGGLKGKAFGKTVDEIDSLRNPSTNSQSASVFGDLTDAQLKESARRVANISDAEIRQLVLLYGPRDVEVAEELIETLIARKKYIKQRFKIRATRKAPESKPAAPPKDTGKDVTDFEVQQIEDARLNGYVLHRDKDAIEDQAVLAWKELDANGDPRSMLQMKLRGDAAEGLDRAVGRASNSGLPSIETAPLDDLIKKSIIGLKHRVETGGTFDNTIETRLNDALQASKKIRKQISDAINEGTLDRAVLKTFDSTYDEWIDAIKEAVIYYDADDKIEKHWFGDKLFNTGRMGTLQPVAKKAADDDVIKWTKRRGEFEHKDVNNGIARVKGGSSEWGTMYETTIDDVTVRYWAGMDNDQVFAIKNRLEVIAPGKTHEQALNTLRKLGINVDRATDFDAEELYLRQIMAHRREGFGDFNASINRIKDPAKRVQRARDLVSAAIGRDVTELPMYNFKGQYQAFGHGQRHLMRPDLFGKEWDDFAENYRLHHSITQGDIVSSLEAILNSGGQMAPTTDKLRRGIPIGGMSPSSDMGTGGASYFFTRIKTANSAAQNSGFVWKADHLRRLDSISYNHDAFGKVKGQYVQRNRKTGIEEWKQTAGSGGNETIFKNSLSIFDDLESINVKSESQKKTVVRLFKKHGINEWPDGRSLDEIVKVIGW